MTLSEGQINKKYRVNNTSLDADITRRLESLGLTDGTVITILNKKFNGAVIFTVRGTRLAVGKIIACAIEIAGIKDSVIKEEVL